MYFGAGQWLLVLEAIFLAKHEQHHVCIPGRPGMMLRSTGRKVLMVIGATVLFALINPLAIS
jgi:hypothetical protein